MVKGGNQLIKSLFSKWGIGFSENLGSSARKREVKRQKRQIDFALLSLSLLLRKTVVFKMSESESESTSDEQMEEQVGGLNLNQSSTLKN